MADINNLRFGDGYPDALMLNTYLQEDQYANQNLTFTSLSQKDNSKVWASVLGDWQINDGWEIEILSPKKIAIKKFRIDTWGLRKIWSKGNANDTDPLGYNNLIQLRLKVSGLDYVHKNVIYQEDSSGNKTYGFTQAYAGTGGYNVYWYPGQFTSGNYIQGLGIQSSIGYTANANEIEDSFQMGKHPWDVGRRSVVSDGIFQGTWSDGGYRATSIGLFGGYQTASKWHEYTTEGYTGTAYKIWDISDTPIIIDLKASKTPSSIFVSPHRAEVWDSYFGDTHVYHKDKTVENCLSKYYNGTAKTISSSSYPSSCVNGNAIILKEVSGNKYTLPDPREIVDLYPDGINPSIDKWNLTNLRLELTTDASSALYVEWINKYLESIADEVVEYSSPTDYFAHTGIINMFSGLWIENTEENPVVLRIGYKCKNLTTGTAEYHPDVVLDRLVCDYEKHFTINRTSAKIGFLRIEDTNSKVVTLQRAFRGFNGTLDIKYTMKPHTLDDTFTAANIKGIPLRNGSGGEITGYVDNEIPPHWINWGKVDDIRYAFESSAITAIRCYPGDPEIGVGDRFNQTEPNTSTEELDDYGATDKHFRWPSYMSRSAVKDSNGTQTGWNYSYNGSTYPRSYTQAFNTANLKIIEPIIRCKYLVTANQIYRSFRNGITSIKLKGLNNFSWDFCDKTPSYCYCPNLDADSIRYMIENAEDQISTPYNANYAPDWNVHNGYTGTTRYDYVNIRSSESQNGLYINYPGECAGFCITSGHGWSLDSGAKYTKHTVPITARASTTATANSVLVYYKKPLTNFKFRISGLVDGDILAVGKNQGVSAQTYTYTVDGEYTIESFNPNSENWGFRLYNPDTTITSTVTVSILGVDEYPEKITPELITLANSKGWTIMLDSITVTPEQLENKTYF